MEDPRKLEEGLETGTKLMNKKDHNISNEKERKSITTSDLPEEQREEQPLVKQKTKRVATLDAFRGLTIVLMILVDDAGGAYPRIDHSPWNGCTLADFVMPFFLFIVGVAIALALKRIPKVNHAIRKITLRTLKLLFWGILLQGGYSHAPDDLSYGVDMKKIRWCGILQRIALVYFVVALIETLTTKLRPTNLNPGHLSIFTAYKWQWIGGFVAFVIYMVTTFSLYVSDWSFIVHQHEKTERYTVISNNFY
ncbi:Heparan-alpha-glucosaminide N-acetyltransferase [Handroanthus impetiginosus]|uniref:Heparan-alpha-glucosaminide N-acetyltransferase n=1 Tax=Handroanthus impetiginosus TaxID=429701 RepID=A0A2G9GYE7_9LAMI|nr:Heparan-alpha-glucosaminide N-acetyltransferase [Handroanthus impetiginosus]